VARLPGCSRRVVASPCDTNRRHTTLRRSHKLQPDEVGASVRAIAPLHAKESCGGAAATRRCLLGLALGAWVYSVCSVDARPARPYPKDRLRGCGAVVRLVSGLTVSFGRPQARCGAGTNNIPIDEMTARGIPVFNTPGANANSVKELVLAGLLMASRGVVEGIHHTQTKIVPESKGDHKVRVRVWVRVRVRVPRSCLSQRAITR
jgi:hypothetical protein